jgi:hypothetical protein
MGGTSTKATITRIRMKTVPPKRKGWALKRLIISEIPDVSSAGLFFRLEAMKYLAL